MAKTYTAQDILDLMETNDYFVCACLSKMLDRQTRDEQETASTKHHNGKGFNAYDAKFLTKLAILARRDGYLSPGRLACARKSLRKYVNQLVEIANDLANP